MHCYWFWYNQEDIRPSIFTIAFEGFQPYVFFHCLFVTCFCYLGRGGGGGGRKEYGWLRDELMYNLVVT